MTAHKAWVAAIVGFVGPILSYLGGWLATQDPWAWRTFFAAVIGSAITCVAAGGFTWAIPNQPKVVAQHSTAGVALENSHSPNMEG